MNILIEKPESRFWLVRYITIKLGKTGNPELIKALKDENETVRMSAAMALGKSGDPVAVQPLIKALRHKNGFVRRNAAEALGKIGGLVAVQALIDVLNYEYCEADCKNAIYALKNAIYALKDTGSPDAIKPLTDILKNNTDGYLRGIAVEALGEIDDPEVFYTLISALKDIDGSVRIKAIEALEKTGNPDAVQPVIGTLKDNNPEVRRRAVRALEKISGPDVVKPLINALKVPDYYLRRSVAEELGKLGESIALQPLIEALEDDYEARVRAAEALAEIGDTVAIHPIVNALKHMLLSKMFDYIKRIIFLNKRAQESHPHLLCGKCLLKTENKTVKSIIFDIGTFTACRNCNSCLHLIYNVRKAIGLIGGDIEDYRVNNDRVYISLWSETHKKSRNADIDVLEIRETQGISYEYAINSVLVTLKNDVSRPKEYIKSIPVIIYGNPAVPEGSMKVLAHEFKGIKNE